jgi:hypothetical protein
VTRTTDGGAQPQIIDAADLREFFLDRERSRLGIRFSDEHVVLGGGIWHKKGNSTSLTSL